EILKAARFENLPHAVLDGFGERLVVIATDELRPRYGSPVDLLRRLQDGLGRPLRAADDGGNLAAPAGDAPAFIGSGTERCHFAPGAFDGGVDEAQLVLVGLRFCDLR